ncbi:MAG: hypothetical protein M1469_01620 [Bacteroidetes bacterium]|nr:hypothetical protein [Bacteroidota bacterium]
MTEQKEFYRRHLPHWQPPDATYHVTFRLKGSLPGEVIERLRAEREEAKRMLLNSDVEEGEEKRLLQELQWTHFERFDTLLHTDSGGLRWLKEPAVASIVNEAIHYRDGKEYDLLAHSIMPNHVHMVFSLLVKVCRNDIPTYKPLFRVMQSLKRHTATRSNLILDRSGAFWQDESYDHIVRNADELDRTIRYVLNNPVKSGLVESWEQWPWSYVRPDLIN